MELNFEVTMNEYLPLRDVVFNTLRQAILKGELKPGERLMEIQLANKLGVSRTPIREAIRKLELEGLVLMIPRKGAEVAEITEKSLRDVLEVRKALEELAVQLAVNSHTVLKSFEALEADGIIYSRRGLGFFLADDARERALKALRAEFFEITLRDLFKSMEMLGVSIDDVVARYRALK